MRNKALLILIIMLIFDITYSYAQWENISPNLTQNFVTAYFLHADTGYANGGIDNKPLLQFTHTGGQSWTTQKETIPPYYSMLFTSIDTGYFLTGHISTGVIFLYTHDGGVNVDTAYYFPGNNNIKDLSRIMKNHNNNFFVYYTTSQDTSLTGLRKSTDRGLSWNRVSPGHIIHVSFVNNSLGYGLKKINNDTTRIVKTTDGGDSWLEIGDAPSRANKIQFITSDTGYCRVPGSTTSGGIYRTTDGGSSWQAIHNGLPGSGEYIADFGFTNSTGYLILGKEGVFKTTDAGNTWVNAWDKRPCLYSNMQVLDEQTVFVWTDGSVGGVPCLYRTLNGGDTVTTSAGKIKPPFIDFRLYPNPATADVTIEARDAFPGERRIDVYNMLGQKVYSASLHAEGKSMVHRFSTEGWGKGMHAVHISNGLNAGRKLLVVR